MHSHSWFELRRKPGTAVNSYVPHDDHLAAQTPPRHAPGTPETDRHDHLEPLVSVCAHGQEKNRENKKIAADLPAVREGFLCALLEVVFAWQRL